GGGAGGGGGGGGGAGGGGGGGGGGGAGGGGGGGGGGGRGTGGGGGRPAGRQQVGHRDPVAGRDREVALGRVGVTAGAEQLEALERLGGVHAAYDRALRVVGHDHQRVALEERVPAPGRVHQQPETAVGLLHLDHRVLAAML